MHHILEDTFIETHMVDVRRKLLHFWYAMMAKILSFKLTNTPMVEVAKFYFVLVDQMKNEQLMKVVSLEQLQGTHGEARKDGPLPNHIGRVLVRYKDVFTNRLFKKLSLRTGE